MTIIAVDVRNRKSVVLARSLPNDVAVDLQRAMKSWDGGRMSRLSIDAFPFLHGWARS